MAYRVAYRMACMGSPSCRDAETLGLIPSVLTSNSVRSALVTTPSQVTIRGAKSAVKRTESLFAAKVSLNGRRESFTQEVTLTTPEKFTIPVLLNQFRGLYVTDWTLMMAATTIAVIPVLIIYLIGQRYIIEGVALTGLKR